MQQKMALDNAQRLAPNSTETLFALGYYQYWVLHDYGAAKTTFGRVTKMLPSNNEIPWGFGPITRPEGNLIWIFNPAQRARIPTHPRLLLGSHDTATRTRPDWFDAEDEAVASGGHLVTINDEAEKNWLVSLFVLATPFWTAGGPASGSASPTSVARDRSTGISGETPKSTSWDGGQPDNAHALGEDSVHTKPLRRPRLWNDLGPQRQLAIPPEPVPRNHRA